MKFLLALFLITNSLFAAEVDVWDAKVRYLPASSPNTGMFLKLVNNTGKNINLIEAKSKIAKRVELHTHKNVGGVMRMRQVKAVSIPAYGETQLRPGSFHVMFMGLKKPLKYNKKVKVELVFDNGQTTLVEAPTIDIVPEKSKKKSCCH